jgi:hypothetical protein
MAYEANSTSIFQPYLKNMWHKGRVVDMAARKMPFYGMLKKTTDFYGEDRKVTVKYVNPMGRSATFSNTQDNAKAGRAVRFTVTRKSNYGTCFLNSETIEASQNNVGALYKALDEELEGVMQNLLQDLQIDLCRNGGGSRGVCDTPVVPGGGAPDYIPLDTARDVRNFEVNMVLKAGTTDGTTATTFRSTPATATITKIDRSAGRIYFAAGTFTGTNWVADDHLYVQGDVNATTTLGVKVKGLAAHIPYTAPSSGESFNGVDRTTDTDRLAGLRRDLSTYTLENGIITLAADISEAGGDPDVALISPRQFANLEISLGGKVRYDKAQGVGDMAKYGWKAISIATDNGDVKVVADRGMPDNRVYVLTMDTWEFSTLGEAPKVIQLDGNKITRVSNADDVEFRAVYRGDLLCNAPGHNGVGQIQT